MKSFIKAALIRATKTFCQCILAMVPAASTIEAVSWGVVLSTSALAALLSICTSVVTGLPEVE